MRRTQAKPRPGGSGRRADGCPTCDGDMPHCSSRVTTFSTAAASVRLRYDVPTCVRAGSGAQCAGHCGGAGQRSGNAYRQPGVLRCPRMATQGDVHGHRHPGGQTHWPAGPALTPRPRRGSSPLALISSAPSCVHSIMGLSGLGQGKSMPGSGQEQGGEGMILARSVRRGAASGPPTRRKQQQQQL